MNLNNDLVKLIGIVLGTIVIFAITIIPSALEHLEHRYKAQFQGGSLEIYNGLSNETAIQQAYQFEIEHGTLVSVCLLDSKCNEIKRIL